MPTYRLARPLAIAPQPQRPNGELSLSMYSPRTGGLLQVSFDVVRMLSAFGAGRAPDEVARQLTGDADQAAVVAEAAQELQRHGMLKEAATEASSPPALRPLFLSAPTGSLHERLDSALDAHPALACTPPLSLLQAFRRTFESALGTDSISGLRLQRAEYLAEVRKALTTLLAEFARRRQKTSWVYRSRNLPQVMAWADEVFEQKSRFIAVVRHPLDAVHTMLQFLKPDRAGLPSDHPARDLLLSSATPHQALAEYWRDVLAGTRAFRDLAKDRVTVVPAESLVGPRRDLELMRVFEQLGLKWEPLADAPAPKDSGVHNPEPTIAQPQDTEAGGWKSWPKPVLAQVVQTRGLADEAKAFGYSMPPV